MHADVRLTSATLDVLEVVAAADGSPVYGFQISTLTRRPTGTVYPVLSRLERVGWLEGAWESDNHRGSGPRRKYYKVTGQGREQIAVALRRRERPVPVRTPRAEDQADREAGAPVSAEQVIREFAQDLRRLRSNAGNPSLRQLSTRTFYSPASLSEAFSGRSIPSEKLLEVLVRACGGDLHEWALRRSMAEQSIRYGVRIPFRFEDFYALGSRWVRDALRTHELGPEDVEDVTQETLLATYRRWDTVGANLRPWVASYARRVARLLDRTTGGGGEMALISLDAFDGARDVLAPVTSSHAVQGDIAEEVAARSAADHLLHSMGRRTAQIFYLTGEGYQTHEIARLLGMTPSAVEARRRRARNHRRMDLTPEHRRYVQHLTHLRERAGNPSLRRIARRIGYSHTQVAAVFSGATPPPTWEFTVRLVSSLGGAIETARWIWEMARPSASLLKSDSYADMEARSGDAFALWRLTDRLERMGRTADAVGVWRTAAETGNTYAMAVTAELLERVGNVDEAETWLQRAAGAGGYEAKRELARFLERARRTEEAIDVWRRAAADGEPEAKRELFVILDRLGRHDEALRVWERSAEPGSTSAARMMGERLMHVGRPDQAEDYLRRAAEAGDPSARRQLAVLLHEAGRVDEAIEVWRRPAENGYGYAVQELATLLDRAGRVDEAIEVLRAAAGRGHGFAMQGLATLLEREGRVDEAVDVWRQISDDATGAEERATASRALARLLDKPLASMRVEAELRAAVNAGDSLSLLALARLLDQEGRDREAETLLRDAAVGGDSLAAEALAHRRLQAKQVDSHADWPSAPGVEQSGATRLMDRRERLMSAAYNLFANPGFHDTTTERLCALARVSQRDFLECFSGRDELMRVVYTRCVEDTHAVMAAAIAQAPATPAHRVKAAVAEYVRFVTADSRRARLMHIQAGRVGDFLDGARKKAAVRFARILEQAVHELPGPTGRTPPLLTLGLGGAIGELITDWLQTDRPPSIDVVTGAAVHLVTSSLQV
ncbi:helix-turn-helix domain-containing protein [Microbispora siamensis]